MARTPASPAARIIDPKDLGSYYRYLEWLVRWIPAETVAAGVSRRNVYHDIVNFYFILAQDSLAGLQQPIEPGPVDFGKYPLSEWVRDFAAGWGSFLDTPESAAGIPTFQSPCRPARSTT